MAFELIEIAGRTALVCDQQGPLLREATDMVGESLSAGARLVVIPAERLDPEFFHLASGVAGEMLQKFVNYRCLPVIVGDISGHVGASNALRDFVRESNRGTSVWFVADVAALEVKLGNSGPG